MLKTFSDAFGVNSQPSSKYRMYRHFQTGVIAALCCNEVPGDRTVRVSARTKAYDCSASRRQTEGGRERRWWTHRRMAGGEVTQRHMEPHHSPTGFEPVSKANSVVVFNDAKRQVFGVGGRGQGPGGDSTQWTVRSLDFSTTLRVLCCCLCFQQFVYELGRNDILVNSCFHHLHQCLQYHILGDSNSQPLACLVRSLQSIYTPQPVSWPWTCPRYWLAPAFCV
ncbi:hypothetical protein ACOMHN_011583 [Nucella lapillus]